MKKIKDTAAGKLYTVYRVLLLLLMIIIVLIAGGGIFSLLRSSESGPLFRLGGTGAGNVRNNSAAHSGTGVFNGIGRMRIPVASRAGGSATLIISISFPYPDEDRPFAEELGSKIANLRNITNEYFSSLPASSFNNFNEDNAKTELLKRYNTILRLGKIEILYFSDFIILE